MRNNWKREAAAILKDFGFTNQQILVFIKKARETHISGNPVALYNATLKLAYNTL